VNLFGLGNSHPAIASLLYVVLCAGISTAILWPFTRARLFDRLPIILTVVMGLLEGAVELVPSVMPRVFESVLGHAIHAMTTTREAGGTLLTMPWLERWQETNGKRALVDCVGRCAVGDHKPLQASRRSA
jgi:hypothetical protein